MLPTIKQVFVLIFFPCLLFSCKFDNDHKEGKEQKLELTDSISSDITVSDITPEQKTAFDALNTLQVNADTKNRLYSTFANLDQPCYPADTSFVITQSELLIALKHLVKDNYTKLSIEKLEKLIESAVLVQKEYTVLHCRGNSTNINYEKGPPMTGTWVMPNVLNRRDVILVW